MSHEKEVDSKPDSTQFWHPDLENQDSTVEFNSSIGGKRLIINPIGPKDSAQFYHNLLKAAGLWDSQLASTSITHEEFLGISKSSERQIFCIAQDTEKVLEAGYSSEDFGGGRALLLEFKGVGPAFDPTQHAKKSPCSYRTRSCGEYY